MQGTVLTDAGSPLPGVVVSDGLRVTRTDDDGRFRIDEVRGSVFVSRPAGWRADRWYVDATEVDPVFTLSPVPVRMPVRFAHLTDTHLGTGAGYPQPAEIGTGERLSRAFQEIAAAHPGLEAFVVTGDLTDRGLPEEFAAFVAATATTELTVHAIPGNHDHLVPEPTDLVSRNGYAIHSGEPRHYESFLGPRWYSFDLPGLHVVALDWFTHELGLDHETQDAWLRADLEALDPETPWIMLCHDQPWRSILDGLPRAPIATFSGHRHTSRVVSSGTTLHVNTPPAMFGGVDNSPATHRIVVWDGERISIDSQRTYPPRSDARPGRAGTEQARWTTTTPAVGQRTPFVVADGRVVVPVAIDDEARGALAAYDARSGEPLWQAGLDSPLRSAPVAAGTGAIISSTVSGTTRAHDPATGEMLWRRPTSDPLRRFGFYAPTLVDGLVLIGDQAALRALDQRTGETVWERSDIAPYQIFVTLSAPVVDPSGEAGSAPTVLWAGFPEPHTPVRLDPRTGETVPSTDTASTDGLFEVLTRGAGLPIRTPSLDPASGDLVATGLTSVFRRSASGSATRWSYPTSVPWNPVGVDLGSHGALVVDAGGAVAMLDPATGDQLWRTEIRADSDECFLTYRRSPHPLFARATRVGDRLLVPALDGDIVTLDARTGAALGRFATGVPVLAPLVVYDDTAIALHRDGRLVAYPLAALSGALS
ncbi:outer membrane protein assembly factor BamB family protein [Pseudarthrobacter sp. J47]|uniref:outer membrane protein assembly factor BamB family protein n=1 Tax=Pseudarthrobacter sp. J47 TaxID=3116482 RepID=UPI002E8223EE|nr:PQQ-binding-like beta-propeller repeat protein [Pseudarthrobacter sp. J47]MEE2524514.1 PQQ-binding-like beta-propeller repeat protein [Pseudarthrobacter sp. J47]